MLADAGDGLGRAQNEPQHQLAVGRLGEDHVLELAAPRRHVVGREPRQADELAITGKAARCPGEQMPHACRSTRGRRRRGCRSSARRPRRPRPSSPCCGSRPHGSRPAGASPRRRRARAAARTRPACGRAASGTGTSIEHARTAAPRCRSNRHCIVKATRRGPGSTPGGRYGGVMGALDFVSVVAEVITVDRVRPGASPAC